VSALDGRALRSPWVSRAPWALRGVIRRRILVNFRVDAEVAQRQLPAPFRPKLLDGAAVAGVCLVRLERVRPGGLPAWVGRSSENAAHRIAVEWTGTEGERREGVYIPRRDTGSPVNRVVGGRLFPGEHARARFEVSERDGRIDLEVRTADGQAGVQLRAREARELPASSRFASLEEASRFFRDGADGYSPSGGGARLDGLRLCAEEWRVEPLAVDSVHAAYFADGARFPRGSVAFDCALIMRDVAHEWRAAPGLS
jgi:uncharacterized protein YqjF (DUF2071 family)